MPDSFEIGPKAEQLLTRALDLWERSLDQQDRYLNFAAQKEERVSANAMLRDQVAVQREQRYSAKADKKPHKPRFRVNQPNGGDAA